MIADLRISLLELCCLDTWLGIGGGAALCACVPVLKIIITGG